MILRQRKKKKNKEISDFCAFDCEAIHWTDIQCCGFFDGKNYYEFRTIEQFIKFIVSLEKNLKIYAHFGGGYDFLFTCEELMKKGYKFKKFIPNGSLIMTFVIETPAGFEITFLDSIFLFHTSLDRVSKSYAPEYTKGKYDHTKNRKYNKEMSKYLKQDCYALWFSLYNFFNHPDTVTTGGGITITAIAQKKMQEFLKEPIYDLPREAAIFCRNAAFGGRVEIFNQVCKTKLYEFDVNSLYPASCLGFFPASKPIYTTDYHKEYLGIYQVKVKAPLLDIPFLPKRTEDGKLIFPTGNFTTYCTNEDIEYAKKLGYRFEIISGYYFTRKTKFLKEYIEYYYNLKKNAPKGSSNEDLFKRFLNHVYGRFLIKKDRQIIVFEADDQTDEFREFNINGKNIMLYTKNVQIETHSNEAIGSFILSRSKMILYDYILEAQKQKAKFYYTDTDSLKISKNCFKDGKELGEMKLEQISKEAVFLLPKVYITKNTVKNKNGKTKKVVIKGFDNKKIQNISFTDFYNCLSGKEAISIIEDAKPNKFKTSLKQGKFVTMKKKMQKTIKHVYDRRILNRKTGETSPIKLMEF